VTPVDLLLEIILEHMPDDIWKESRLIRYRMLGNTNRGQIGEEFIRRFLAQEGIAVESAGRVSLTDLQIDDTSFAVKTASLGSNGTFQFNHVRLDRRSRRRGPTATA